MLASPSTSGQPNRSAATRPVSLKRDGIERGRRGRPEVDRLGARLPGAMHQRVADAAEPGIPRLDRGERERGRDRGIDRIAAGIEHRDAGLGGISSHCDTTMPRRPEAAGFASCQFWVMWGAGVNFMRG